MFEYFTVYVDASNACNMLNFQLGQTGVDTSIPARQWSIKVSHNFYHFVGGIQSLGLRILSSVPYNCAARAQPSEPSLRSGHMVLLVDYSLFFRFIQLKEDKCNNSKHNDRLKLC
jgi:hypothetical protein